MPFFHGIVILSLLFNFEIVLIQLVFPLEDFGRRCGVLYFFPSYFPKKAVLCIGTKLKFTRFLDHNFSFKTLNTFSGICFFMEKHNLQCISHGYASFVLLQHLDAWRYFSHEVEYSFWLCCNINLAFVNIACSPENLFWVTFPPVPDSEPCYHLTQDSAEVQDS